MGCCQCGCGGKTRISPTNDRSNGYVKGQPRRFIAGHSGHQFRPGEAPPGPGRPFKPGHDPRRGSFAAGHDPHRFQPVPKDDAGYRAIHYWLCRNHPKTGVCEECGREVGTTKGQGTEYANISGEYRRDRVDYRELCVPCHRIWDAERRKVAA
jgi:hypothetical protein